MLTVPSSLVVLTEICSPVTGDSCQIDERLLLWLNNEKKQQKIFPAAR
jgi:hypothetical protein